MPDSSTSIKNASDATVQIDGHVLSDGDFRQTVYAGTSPVGAVTSVVASTASVQLLGANLSRMAFEITNDGASVMYVKCASTSTTASSTSWTSRLQPGETYLNSRYSGIVTAIWVAADGNARITEYLGS